VYKEIAKKVETDGVKNFRIKTVIFIIYSKYILVYANDCKNLL